MINPTVKQFQYFPLVTSFFDDENYQDVFDEYGPIIDSIFIRALGLIYENGYFLEIDSKRFAKKIYRSLKHQDGPSEAKVYEILTRMAECSLFDKELFKEGVMTSHGIQKRYCFMAGKRKIILENYLLLTKAEMVELNVLESNLENHKRKGKEIKGNKQKEKELDEIEINIDKGFYENYFEPSKWTKVLIDNDLISDSDLKIPNYNNLFRRVIDSYKVTDMAKAYSYLVRYLKHPSYKIDDMYAYIRHALIENTDWVSHEDERIAYFEQLSKDLEELKQQEIADQDEEDDNLPF